MARGTPPVRLRWCRGGARAAQALLVLLLWSGVCGLYEIPDLDADPRGPHKLFRLDGKYVHNVGRIQLQMTNIGFTGNPLTNRTSVPSCEWPVGSGTIYLNVAGLWVGALDASGIPHVTSAPNTEFSPEVEPDHVCVDLPIDQVADIRETYEGALGGNRVISASVNPDDDGDGLIDEDFLNGLDDDGDGRCDEDYSAIGQQMFATEYVDYIEQLVQIHPSHVPLGIKVQQSSYAWGAPGQDNFVGIDYKIINKSDRVLRRVYVAIFADCDIGELGSQGYWSDDLAGLIDTTVTYTGPAGEPVSRRIQIGYMWDHPDNPDNQAENKGGDVPGFIGCMFLGHTTDPAGLTAPPRVGITAFKFFAGGGLPYLLGGDPRTDAERYQLMADPELTPERQGQICAERPLDHRFVMATGPFQAIPPDSALTISIAWVMGKGRGPSLTGESLIDNAIVAQQVFDGLYTDLDGDPLTGQCGKETAICNSDLLGQSMLYSIPDTSICRDRFRTNPTRPELTPWDPFVPCDLKADGKFVCQDRPGGTIGDEGAHCVASDTTDLVLLPGECAQVDLDCNVNTGQGGREHLVNWVAASGLPSPLYPGQDGKGEVSDFLERYRTRDDSTQVTAWFFPGDRHVTLKWNNFAELVRDAQRGNLKEFVGYRIYKAAGWKRPYGTNSPSRDLWQLLGEWRVESARAQARPLSELIDPSARMVSVTPVAVQWDPAERRARYDSIHVEADTLFAVGRYSYVDAHVLNGFPYFYSIVPISIIPGYTPAEDTVIMGNPSASNAQVVYPRGDAAPDQKHVFVVPNPYRGGAPWDLVPRTDDPSGTKVTFMNLPRTKGTVHIFTLAGDLVKDLRFDGRPVADLQYGKDPLTSPSGSVSWNLISRNGQRIASGIYLYCVDSSLGKQVGRFVIIR